MSGDLISYKVDDLGIIKDVFINKRIPYGKREGMFRVVPPQFVNGDLVWVRWGGGRTTVGKVIYEWYDSKGVHWVSVFSLRKRVSGRQSPVDLTKLTPAERLSVKIKEFDSILLKYKDR